MAGNTRMQRKRTLAQLLKAEVRDRKRKPGDLTLDSRARKGVVQTNTDALLCAEGAAQNPLNSDRDICFCTFGSLVAKLRTRSDNSLI